MSNEDYLASFVNNCTSRYTFESEILNGLCFLIFDIIVLERRQISSIDEINLLGSFCINTKTDDANLVTPFLFVIGDHLLCFCHLAFTVVAPGRIEHN